MAFDTTELNAACLDIGDDAVLMLDTGPVGISIIITDTPDLDNQDGYGVLTSRLTGETTVSVVKGIQRGSTIVQNEMSYQVNGWDVDVTGWMIIELEKI